MSYIKYTRGRPKPRTKSKKLPVVLSKELYEKLELYAKANAMSKAQVLRTALIRHLNSDSYTEHSYKTYLSH